MHPSLHTEEESLEVGKLDLIQVFSPPDANKEINNQTPKAGVGVGLSLHKAQVRGES